MIACGLTRAIADQEAGDATQLGPLLDHIDDEISQFTADGAYDGTPTYEAVLRHSALERSASLASNSTGAIIRQNRRDAGGTRPIDQREQS